MPRDGTKNLIPQSKRTKEEQRKIAKMGGKASGEARRQKRDMRELMKMMLEMNPKDEDKPYAYKVTEAMLSIASDTKQGGAAVRAYQSILHIIGQDEPEPRQDAIELLKAILEENRQSARVQAESETE